jgi:hypothetical protein
MIRIASDLFSPEKRNQEIHMAAIFSISAFSNALNITLPISGKMLS